MMESIANVAAWQIVMFLAFGAVIGGTIVLACVWEWVRAMKDMEDREAEELLAQYEADKRKFEAQNRQYEANRAEARRKIEQFLVEAQ